VSARPDSIVKLDERPRATLAAALAFAQLETSEPELQRPTAGPIPVGAGGATASLRRCGRQCSGRRGRRSGAR